MSNFLLSILIPTVVGREDSYNRLFSDLTRQSEGLPVEIVPLKDNKEMTIGEKRQRLYQGANGLYSFMPDDDDSVSSDFIQRVMSALSESPDCVTYYEHVDIDGDISKSNHSIKYSGWHDNPDWPEGFKYARTPYFKDVIRTDIAKRVSVPELRWNEDEQWANALHPHLKNEYHIDDFMYFYQHRSSNFNERYGIK